MIYGVYHMYDVDGGFGDAVTRKDLLCVFLNKEDAEAFAKQYEDEHEYDAPYAALYCGAMIVEELPTQFNADMAWWKRKN